MSKTNSPVGFFTTNPSNGVHCLYRGAIECALVGSFFSQAAAVAKAWELRAEYLAEVDAQIEAALA